MSGISITKGVPRVSYQTLLIDKKTPDSDARLAVLRHAGYTVQACTCGKDGLAYFFTHRLAIDLMIISTTLDDMSCHDIIRTIQEQGHLPHLIVISDQFSPKETIHYMKAGASDILERSHHPLELILSANQARDRTVILENIHRNTQRTLDITIQHRLRLFTKFLNLRKKESKPILPSEIYSFFPFSIHQDYSPETIAKAIQTHSLHKLLGAQKKPTVLIVDDERFMCSLLDSILNQEFNILIASSGFEALSLFTAHYSDIDVVLLDIAMPHATGDRLISKLLTIDPTVVILMLTAFKDTDLIIRTLRAGARDYITKPFLNHKVLEVVSMVAQGKFVQAQLTHDVDPST